MISDIVCIVGNVTGGVSFARLCVVGERRGVFLSLVCVAGGTQREVVYCVSRACPYIVPSLSSPSLSPLPSV